MTVLPRDHTFRAHQPDERDLGPDGGDGTTGAERWEQADSGGTEATRAKTVVPPHSLGASVDAYAAAGRRTPAASRSLPEPVWAVIGLWWILRRSPPSSRPPSPTRVACFPWTPIRHGRTSAVMGRLSTSEAVSLSSPKHRDRTVTHPVANGIMVR
ncbi:hypothetical protein CPLU01_00307 [Colletotrichum plurivorum]|uniref:Uncharacterized protein n=1 Tax=Colletotrichum plurivorum TaxID=2175906 RepID=A0A8H6U6E4_9PEZI|nr:hypothetical protein CPLU01_00307 [Colletotrichum plurivorum]